MDRSPRRVPGLRVFCLAATAVLTLTMPPAPRAEARQEADEPRLAEFYGFLPLELYKLEDRISNLLIADLDGDEVGDLAVADNARSRIDLLLSTPGAADEEGTFGYGPNRLTSASRLRLKTVSVSKEVVSLQAGDLDGDGDLDLAYYGDPAELTVLYNEGGGRFGRPARINTGSAVDSGSALDVGDIDGDGRADLVLMASNEVVTVLQKADGSLGRPDRLPHTATRPGILKLVDLDGDGRLDLTILSGDDDPLRVRFARPGGTLGPEERFGIEQARAMAFGELDGEQGVEVLTIESQSGRASAYSLREGPAEGEDRPGRLVVYPLPPGSGRDRAVAVGDLDGDGKADVVVTDPENAQVFVSLRDEQDGALGAIRTYPGLLGGSAVAAADLDGDDRDEVYVLSEREKQIGQSQIEDGRLSFPTPMPTTGGEPVGLSVADLDGDGQPELVYVARQKVEDKDAYTLRGLERTENGDYQPFRWGQVDAVPIEGLSGPPKGVKLVDINADGHLDVIVFDPYAAPALLLGREGGEPPSRSTVRPGPLAGLDPNGLTIAPLGDAQAIFAAQGSFARSVALDAAGQWQVREQFNTGRTSSRVEAAATLDADGEGPREVVLLDRTAKALVFLEADSAGGSYRQAGTIPVGSIDFRGFFLADFDDDGRDDLLVAGAETFAVVLTGGTGRSLKRIASIAPDREDARYADLISGDVNGDGVPDVILMDTIEHYLEIAAYLDGGLRRGLSFPVFEQKSFHDIDDLVEPREIALGDVDGDGRTDIALIVHDRILIYRQDPGPAADDASKAADAPATDEADAADTDAAAEPAGRE